MNRDEYAYFARYPERRRVRFNPDPAQSVTLDEMDRVALVRRGHRRFHARRRRVLGWVLPKDERTTP
jgi:hypothetical protein